MTATVAEEAEEWAQGAEQLVVEMRADADQLEELIRRARANRQGAAPSSAQSSAQIGGGETPQ